MTTAFEGPGSVVQGRYRLIDLAGRGTMAEVWRAEQLGAEGFHRPVAVKRMLSRLVSSPGYRAMFVREAQLNALLDHPNVVQVLDFGVDVHGFFLVTEWVEGLSMRDINGLCHAFGVRASPVLIAAIGIEVLRALEAAHAHTTRGDDGVIHPTPVIHRDISPANVLLSVRGVVKLADFGIARTLDDPGLTPAGAMLPRLGYMAPEVVSGQQPGIAADLYAVGVLLWESIAGRRLWQGRTDAEVILALAHGIRPPPLQSIRPDVPPALAAAIDHALQASPTGRYPSATAFARVLSDTLRLIPERTDTTRLATEVANALNLRRQLEARRPRTQPPVAGPLRPRGFHATTAPVPVPVPVPVPAQGPVQSEPLPSVMVMAEPDPDDARATLELVDAFPSVPQASPTDPSPPPADGASADDRPSVELHFGALVPVDAGAAEPQEPAHGSEHPTG